MTKTQKITKLARAIKLYRGMTTPEGVEPKKWINPPQKHRIEDIKRWLTRLNAPDVDLCIKEIDGFKTFPTYFQWLRDLESGELVNIRAKASNETFM